MIPSTEAVAALRSRRWFGPAGLRSFRHRTRAKQMGWAEEDWKDRPIIAILNTWSLKLGAQTPDNSSTWGTGRAALAANVPPGQKATFSFTVTAPAPGTHIFQWRPVQESIAWFGDFTLTITVKVTP